MKKILMLLMKKPSDKTTRIIKTIFALLYMASLGYAFFGSDLEITLNFFWQDLSAYSLYVEVLLISFWIPSFVSWVFDKNLLKSKNTRIMQVVFWIFIIYLCWRVIPVSNWLADITILLTLMWWFYIFAWALWKLITKQWKRQWEKITKVRV